MNNRMFTTQEYGTIHKKWRGKIPVAVIFPNSYYLGMSNLAVHMLYKSLNDFSDIVCERVFYEEGKTPLSFESRRGLDAFEILFFTLSYELDFVNVVKMLTASSIPLLSKDRGESDPIIVAGGITMMANPEPVSGLFDLIILGDIESTIDDFINRYMEGAGKERRRIIEGCSGFSWVYNPRQMDVDYNGDGTIRSFHPPEYRVTINRFKGKRLGISSIIARDTEFSEMLLLEATRGCPSRCPFCLLGNVYRYLVDPVIPLETEVNDIGFVGGGVSFHPDLINIVSTMKSKGKGIHFPSLRIDKVPLELIRLIKDEIKTLTFGIEAGTERIRKAMGKPFGDEEILHKIEGVLDIKPFNIKLYFMVGLPEETEEDVEAIVKLTKRVKHIMVKKGARKGQVGSITIHASPFVPKAATPFQRMAMDDMETLKKKVSILKRGLGKVENTYFTHESVKYSFIQAAFARGDRKMIDVVIEFAKGANLNRVMRESPVNLNFYALRRREEDELLPWGFISFPIP
ncbi:MAG: B12-binding domain-containing radical SAM protein [Syntrophorhabdaceae bacterium]|nr:B12-binding domain-containing radical SAM protein [Syntrophorhabdaceae bacterium]